MELLSHSGFDGVPEAFRILLNESMKAERSAALGADLHQRSSERIGYANGYKPKTVATRIGQTTFEVPQVRGGVEFYPSALEKGVRSERALKLALAEMYVQGVSTRKVTAVMQELCGLDVSSSQVSRATALLDEELSAWRTRPIGPIPYLILDARYENVRHAGAVVRCAVLIALGVRQDGKRSCLGVSVSLSEAEVHWREFLRSLQERGLHGVRYIVSDDHAGLKAALSGRFAGTPWHRCQFHICQDAMQYVPKLEMRKEVGADLRDIFDAPDRAEAQRRLDLAVEKYSQKAPKLSEWMEGSVPEGFTAFVLPPTHRRQMRTTNMLENLNKQIKRRTRVATLFPNEGSLLRLVTAVLMETSDDWETGKLYLTMNLAN
jgi:transposase-like protein